MTTEMFNYEHKVFFTQNDIFNIGKRTFRRTTSQQSIRMVASGVHSTPRAVKFYESFNNRNKLLLEIPHMDWFAKKEESFARFVEAAKLTDEEIKTWLVLHRLNVPVSVKVELFNEHRGPNK